MRANMNLHSFGSKGGDESSLSFADLLLSGQPIKRTIEPEIQHLKPRPKAQFGHKLDQSSPDPHKSISHWKFWAGAVALLAVALQTVL